MTAPLTDEARHDAELKRLADRAYRFEMIVLTTAAEAIGQLKAYDREEGQRLWAEMQEKIARANEPLPPEGASK